MIWNFSKHFKTYFKNIDFYLFFCGHFFLVLLKLWIVKNMKLQHRIRTLEKGNLKKPMVNAMHSHSILNCVNEKSRFSLAIFFLKSTRNDPRYFLNL